MLGNSLRSAAKGVVVFLGSSEGLVGASGEAIPLTVRLVVLSARRKLVMSMSS